MERRAAAEERAATAEAALQSATAAAEATKQEAQATIARLQAQVDAAGDTAGSQAAELAATVAQLEGRLAEETARAEAAAERVDHRRAGGARRATGDGGPRLRRRHRPAATATWPSSSRRTPSWPRSWSRWARVCVARTPTPRMPEPSWSTPERRSARDMGGPASADGYDEVQRLRLELGRAVERANSAETRASKLQADLAEARGGDAVPANGDGAEEVGEDEEKSLRFRLARTAANKKKSPSDGGMWS